ncbi:RNA polymerase sigma factor [Actinokineospora globicatena]|uniref:RNA polymerase sigma factor n=1 Tax=Actinokineospora globicatena TaxID=103729 RepID=UPI0020A4138D|nr:sigma-70 family RNA polymerase sigma factor [Actinokineospora globicatena]MCP2301628.1 RNA polymerase sigma factor, sigma-70 family [Actinokineospora globicatena]GLW76717.1 RNA polymerase sigma factor [Actinokineospora globicatena]GLW83550.1 RNA polymerase sigma factor [Actinokineospora globicatena]
MDTLSTTDLLHDALGGGQAAWRELVGRYAPLVWQIARAHRLSLADAADVSQNTWITLAEKAGTIRTPERLGAWLATTARRECLRVIGARSREVSTDQVEWIVQRDDYSPEAAVLRSDRDDLLWRAFEQLSQRCRSLLGLMAFAPELNYAQLAKAVGVANASVSTTRARCLDLLRRKLAVFGMPEGATG